VLEGDSAAPPQKGGRAPQFSAHVCCGQRAGWIKMPLGMEVGLYPSDIVVDEDLAPPPQNGAEPPIFGFCPLWLNGCMDHDVTWYGDRPWLRRHCVRWGPSSPSSKRGQSPQFLAHVCCGQTAGWIKMPLGTMVGLGPGSIVLDADPAPPPRGTAPKFRPCLLWPNSWMDEDATRYEGRPRSRPHCVTWGPSFPSQKVFWGITPDFRPMSIVAKRSPISATAYHLFNVANAFNNSSAVAEMGDRLATIDMDRKVEGCYAPFRGRWSWILV